MILFITPNNTTYTAYKVDLIFSPFEDNALILHTNHTSAYLITTKPLVSFKVREFGQFPMKRPTCWSRNVTV